MRFDHHGRTLGAFEIGRPETDEFIDLIHRAVEQHVVIGNVEMAVVVDPLRFEPHDGRDERRGENRFGIGAVEHIKPNQHHARQRPSMTYVT